MRNRYNVEVSLVTSRIKRKEGVSLYLEVYIDVIFIVNYIMDLLLLFIVKTILKIPVKKIRIFCGALVGGIGACMFVMVPEFSTVIKFLTGYIGIVCIMIGVTFRKQSVRVKIKAGFLLYILTFFLGGFLRFLYDNFRFRNLNGAVYLVISITTGAAMLYIFIQILFSLRRGSLEVYDTELYFKDRKIKLKGLLDTGNSLYDPIYKKPVLIAELTVLKPLFEREDHRFLKKMIDSVNGRYSEEEEEISEELKITMVPYHSIGKSGILPAILMNQVVIWDNKEQIRTEKVLVAVSEGRISKHDEYQIILHRDVM